MKSSTKKSSKPSKAEKALQKAAEPTPAPVTPSTDMPKRVSHLKLGPELLASGASWEDQLKAFTKSFNDRGVTDPTFIEKRARIYMRIAQRKAEAAKQAASRSKAS